MVALSTIVQFSFVVGSKTDLSRCIQSCSVVGISGCILVAEIIRFRRCTTASTSSVRIVARALITNNRPSSNSYCFRNISLLQLHVECVRKMAKITLRESFHRTSLKQHHLDSLRFE